MSEKNELPNQLDYLEWGSAELPEPCQEFIRASEEIQEEERLGVFLAADDSLIGVSTMIAMEQVELGLEKDGNYEGSVAIKYLRDRNIDSLEVYLKVRKQFVPGYERGQEMIDNLLEGLSGLGSSDFEIRDRTRFDFARTLTKAVCILTQDSQKAES